MKRLFLGLLLSVIMGGAAFGQAPKREMRSVWLTTYSNIDWPSKAGVTATAIERHKKELIAFLDSHAKRNFTGVCFQVRSMSDAMYKSSYEPWSQFLTGTRGKEAGWDPLAFVVEECHKRGLECYAWVNPFRYNRRNAARTTPQDVEILSHKGWIIDQGTVSAPDEYKVFNPGMPEVREYLLKVFREIYLNYRIDGMLFDDYFYPNGIPATTQAQDYELFHAAVPDHATDAAGLKKDFGDWRRGNINLFMKQLYDQIQKDRPDMRFGLSPAGIANKGLKDFDPDLGLPSAIPGTSDWQYDDIYSDPLAWLADGSLDFISPQIYWFLNSTSNSYTKAAPYEKLIDFWTKTSDIFGRHFHPSLAPYRFLDSNTNTYIYNNEAHWTDMQQQIDITRSKNTHNAPGQIYFSAKYMDGPACSGWGEWLQDNSYQTPALVPVVDWKEHATPASPVASRRANAIEWSNKAASGSDPIMRYSIYAVPESITHEDAMTADGIDSKYLQTVRYAGYYDIPATLQSGYWFAVCAYDGYGTESAPCFIGGKSSGISATLAEEEKPVVYDGHNILLPSRATEVMVYDIAGECLATASNTARLTFTADPGVYIVVYDGIAARIAIN